MNTLTEIPERCEHPMANLELIVTKIERAPSFAPVLSTSFAVVHCHKCNKNFRMISDFGDWAPRHDAIEIYPRCKG